MSKLFLEFGDEFAESTDIKELELQLREIEFDSSLIDDPDRRITVAVDELKETADDIRQQTRNLFDRQEKNTPRRRAFARGKGDP